jgi:hypothetical protein
MINCTSAPLDAAKMSVYFYEALEFSYEAPYMLFATMVSDEWHHTRPHRFPTL